MLADKKRAPRGLFFALTIFPEESKAKGGRRLIFPFVTETGENKDDDRNDIRKDFVNLAGNERNLHAEIKDHQSAKQGRTPDGVDRTPQAEDNQSDSKPSFTGETFMVPDTAGDGHDIDHAANGGNTAANDGGKVFIKADVDTGRVRGRGIFTDSAKEKTLLRFVEEKRHNNGAGNADINENVITENQFSDYGNILQKLREWRILERAFHFVGDNDVAAFLNTHILTDELADTGSENGKSKTGYVLIGSERNREKAENQSADSTGKKREQQGDQDSNRATGTGTGDFSVIESRAKSDSAAHIHHTFDTKVHITGFFGKNFTGGTKKKGSSVQHGVIK